MPDHTTSRGLAVPVSGTGEIRLSLQRADGTQDVWTAREGVTRIGDTPDATVQVPPLRSLLRQEAEFIVENGRLAVRESRGMVPIWLRVRRVPVPLCNGDVLNLGKTRIIVEICGADRV